MYNICTVGENIIVASKMRNDCAALQSLEIIGTVNTLTVHKNLFKSEYMF